MDSGSRFSVVATLTTGDGADTDEALRDLHRWLSDEETLRGRIAPVTTPVRPDEMGGLLEALEVATASVAMLTALVELSTAWLELRGQRRTANATPDSAPQPVPAVTLTVRTPNGSTELVLRPDQHTDIENVVRRLVAMADGSANNQEGQKMFRIRVEPGQEVLDTLGRQLESRGVRNGAIVSVVGAVGRSCVSTMPKDDASRDKLTEYEEPLEMLGNGAVSDGKPHIHCTLGREGNEAVAGHLHWAWVDRWFVDVFVAPIDS